MLPQTNIDRDFFSEWIDEYNISALIIVSDQTVDSSYIFKKPKMISIVDSKQALEIKLVMDSLDKNHSLFTVIDHNYATNCQEVHGAY